MKNKYTGEEKTETELWKTFIRLKSTQEAIVGFGLFDFQLRKMFCIWCDNLGWEE